MSISLMSVKSFVNNVKDGAGDVVNKVKEEAGDFIDQCDEFGMECKEEAGDFIDQCDEFGMECKEKVGDFINQCDEVGDEIIQSVNGSKQFTRDKIDQLLEEPIDTQLEQLNSDGDTFTIEGGSVISGEASVKATGSFTVTYKDGGDPGTQDDYYEVKVGMEEGAGYDLGTNIGGSGWDVTGYLQGGGKAVLRFDSLDDVKEASHIIARSSLAPASGSLTSPIGFLATPTADEFQFLGKHVEGIELSLSKNAIGKLGIGSGIKNFNLGSVSVLPSYKSTVRINFANTKSNKSSNTTMTVSQDFELSGKGAIGPEWSSGDKKGGLEKTFLEFFRVDSKVKGTITKEYTLPPDLDFNSIEEKSTKINFEGTVNSDIALSLPFPSNVPGSEITEMITNSPQITGGLNVDIENGDEITFIRDFINDPSSAMNDISGEFYLKPMEDKTYEGAPSIKVQGIGVGVFWKYGLTDYGEEKSIFSFPKSTNLQRKHIS